jgi:hypothetical protein
MAGEAYIVDGALKGRYEDGKKTCERGFKGRSLVTAGVRYSR